MHPRNELLLFSLLFSLFFNLARSDASFSFDFPSFTLRNLTLLGDSYLRNGVVGLTRELGVPSSSSGSVIYNNPVRFFDTESNITASFSTRFSFSVDIVNPTSFGDGLAFFISPDNQTLGSPGGYLGLVNSSHLTKNKFVAVEFDTRQDLHFFDPDGNHVGLDMESLVSIKTANARRVGINLRSGNWITAWIDYKNAEKKLEVFLSYSSFKPETPLMEADNVDLSGFLQEFMYVGFSASTEGSTELHYIENWSFQTYGFMDVRPRINPHNVAVNTVPLNKPAIPHSESGNSKHKRLGLGLGIACPAFFCALLLVLGCAVVKRLKSMKPGKNVVGGPRQFSFREINQATNGFHKSKIVGYGGFGIVYLATFESGTTAAVKRSKRPGESKSDFKSELFIMCDLRHRNIVQLLGWCNTGDELLLVYEYMPNGSLDKVLFGEPQPLNWGHRYNIAIGLASVLAYLHEDCDQQVLHMDIKSGNIMLDSDYNPKLGDFGSAKVRDHGHKVNGPTITAGTIGYLAPEYINNGTATVKTDVYSYGVVILEVACGRRPIQDDANLVEWVWRFHSEGRIVEAADPRLYGQFEVEGMKRLLLLGLSCAHPFSDERPSMRRALQILNNEAEPVYVPRVRPTPSGAPPPDIQQLIAEDEDCSRDSSESSHREIIEI